MKCELCQKKLEAGEAILCTSCISFIEWKYGSLENYQKTRNKSVRGGKTQ